MIGIALGVVFAVSAFLRVKAVNPGIPVLVAIAYAIAAGGFAFYSSTQALLTLIYSGYRPSRNIPAEKILAPVAARQALRYGLFAILLVAVPRYAIVTYALIALMLVSVFDLFVLSVIYGAIVDEPAEMTRYRRSSKRQVVVFLYLYAVAITVSGVMLGF